MLAKVLGKMEFSIPVSGFTIDLLIVLLLEELMVWTGVSHCLK